MEAQARPAFGSNTTQVEGIVCCTRRGLLLPPLVWISEPKKTSQICLPFATARGEESFFKKKSVNSATCHRKIAGPLEEGAFVVPDFKGILVEERKSVLVNHGDQRNDH